MTRRASTANPREEKAAPVSGEELAAMGDIGPCELVRGVIVAASPTFPDHGGVEGNFCLHLKAFVRRSRAGRVLVGEVGIYTSRNPDTVRAADVLFISHERYARRKRKRGFLDVAPELIVEVLSESQTWSMIQEKLAEYFSCGVKLVWVADPEERCVHAFRSCSEVSVFGGRDTLTGDDVLPGFRLKVSKLFED